MYKLPQASLQVLFLYPEVKKSIVICKYKIFYAKWFLEFIKAYLGRSLIAYTWRELSFRNGISGDTLMKILQIGVRIF